MTSHEFAVRAWGKAEQGRGKMKGEAHLEVTVAELTSGLANKRGDFRLRFECLFQFGFCFFISVTRNSQVRILVTIKYLQVHEYM